MGLDWCVLPKVENGVKREATAVLGARRLSLEDPDTVAAYRRIWLDQQAQLPRRPNLPARAVRAARRAIGISPSLAELMAQRLEEAAAPWRGSFDEVLVRGLERQPVPVIVIPASGEGAAGIPRHVAFVQYFGFRGRVLEAEHNALTAWSYTQPEGPARTDYGDPDLYADRSADEVLALADRLEAVLAAYLAAHPEPDADGVDAYTDAIGWLRFWGSRGFGYGADY